jgi:hypothetical protein
MPEQYTVEYQKSRANLIFNPSFENAQYSGSLSNATANIVTSPVIFGNYALRLVSITAGFGASYTTPINESRVIAGVGYSASVYVQSQTTPTRLARIGIRFFNSSGTTIGTVFGTDTSCPNGSTVRLEVTISAAPVGSYYAAIIFQFERALLAGTETFIVDGFLLEEGEVEDYFDTTTDPDVYWTGLAYGSVSVLPTDLWVEMENVQQISGNIGRQQFIDTFEPSRMTITARYPYGYGAPNYSLRVGTLVSVSRVGAAYAMWSGRINNTTVEWGIPYENTVSLGVADSVTIECEGALADWGRVQGNDLFVAADDILTQLSNVLSGTGLQYGTTYTAANAPELSSSEVTDSLANWLNTAALTVGATIKDGSDNNIVGINGRDFVGGLPVRFSDQTASATVQKYDAIVFDSVSADFFTEIELNTVDFGDIVVQYRDAPYRTYRATTFSPSIAQAEDLANYLIGIYGDNGFGISEISCKSEAQATWGMDLGYGWWDIIGYWTTVQFRGSTFRVVILGSSFSATPDESRFTYYLADIGLTPFLVLDDANAGRLDNNKLGW